MKRIITILMVACAMTAMVACEDDDEKDNKPNVSQETSTLPDGMYGYNYDSEEGFCYTLPVTNDEGVQTMMYNIEPNYYTEEDLRQNYGGQYTYSVTAGSGSVEFNDLINLVAAGTGHFTYDGDKKTITMTFKGETISMVQTAAWK